MKINVAAVVIHYSTYLGLLPSLGH